jgi:hypothetical protein
MKGRLGTTGLLHEDGRQTIVLAERGKRYVADNVSRKIVLQYRVDGAIVTEGERCDFLLGIPADQEVRLIELKGTDVAKAARQVMATFLFLGGRLIGYVVHGRIVVSHVRRPNLPPTDLVALKKRLSAHGKGTVKLESLELRENI